MRRKDLHQVIYGLVVGVLLSCCAGAGYRFYNIAIPDGCYRDGLLVAHDPKDNLPLEICKPTDHDHGPCVVMQTFEHTRLEEDLDRCTTRLIACEQRPGCQ